MRREHWICAALAVTLVVAAAALVLARDLDLPVDKPAPRAPAPPKPPTPPDPPEQVDEKPPTIYGSEMPRSGSIFFVIDISGSMGMDLDTHLLDRLGRAKAELTRTIDSLPANWKFNALAYDCDPYVWKSTLVEASAENKTSAKAWVAGLKPGGGTGTGDAVAQALHTRENMLVVLLTDGDPNCNLHSANGSNQDPEAHRAIIRAQNVQKATINVFGISAYGTFAEFCRDVATDNNGVFVSVR